MKNLLENFNSKKLAAFAAVVAGILQAEASAELTIAGLVGALAVYVLPQTIVDRGKALANAAVDGAEKANAPE